MFFSGGGVSLVIQWSSSGTYCRRIICINSRFDFPLQMPVENNMEKILCCWLCTSGPISVSARTDRRGYCPGQPQL